tara:strand:- start:833 stop:1084 length:252 start_codon:yes stop_codon:yes gene_type:complete
MKDNKLIAEFMGYPDLGTEGDFTYLKYHREWNWLMPVVHEIDEKCRKYLGLNHSLHIGDDIDAVYSQVVEFIKEHNDEQRKNN